MIYTRLLFCPYTSNLRCPSIARSISCCWMPISNHLGILDKNGYITVTYGYHTADYGSNKIFRSHAIEVLDKAKEAIEAQKNKNP